MKNTSLLKHIINPFTLKPLAVVTLSLMLAAPVSALEETASAGNAAVGEVSLLLGKAYIERANGKRERVTVGSQIKVNDRIETDRNGHVHIRFVDNALLSLRPSSQLEILHYDYKPEAPEDSFVKLNLLEGVTRTTSGKAAKAARENYRLDTPIAAIGVRGTDFVVSSDQDGVRAQVNEGAIVIAPYSNECSATAFGPCSLNALELASGANQIVQISANTNEALLLTLAPPPVPEVIVEPAATAAVVASSETKNKDEELYTDSVSSKAVTKTLALARNVAPAAPLAPPPDLPISEPVPEFTPATLVEVSSLASNQLVWGRYYDTNDHFERITAFVDTFKDTSRRVTVGNDAYGLFRSQSSSREVQPGLGVLGFNLTQAQALYRVNGQAELMKVTGGMLNIDFDQNRFATNLQMNHAATGNVEFSESGRLFGSGIFHSSNANGAPVMAGAVSLDGQQAGYFFEKTLEAGIIEGLTLWGVKP